MKVYQNISTQIILEKKPKSGPLENQNESEEVIEINFKKQVLKLQVKVC